MRVFSQKTWKVQHLPCTSLFNLLYLSLLLLLSPVVAVYALNRKYRVPLISRLFPFWILKLRANHQKQPIWIHGASIGEIGLAHKLAEIISIQSTTPRRFIITASNKKGYEKACQLGYETYYLPFDFTFYISAFIRRIRPSGLIIVETEIWPNLIITASKNFPIFVFNGRLSNASIGKYHAFRRLLAPVLSKIDAVYTYSQEYAERFVSIGLPQDKYFLTGSMKFLAPNISSSKDSISSLIKEKETNRVFLVCGSVQAEEISMIKKALQPLRSKHPSITTVFIPKDTSVIKRFLDSAHQSSHIVWNQNSNPLEAPLPETIYIDAYGYAMEWYSLADFVFVGGSLVKRGGQNMMEPMFLGKPVIVGNLTPNFRAETDILTSKGLIHVVDDATEIVPLLEQFIASSDPFLETGRKASDFVHQQSDYLHESIKNFMTHFDKAVQNPARKTDL